MIEINNFSGRMYTTTGNLKQSNDGETFTKCGSFWFSQTGKTIKEEKDGLVNLKTGIKSNFGDPFDE